MALSEDLRLVVLTSTGTADQSVKSVEKVIQRISTNF